MWSTTVQEFYVGLMAWICVCGGVQCVCVHECVCGGVCTKKCFDYFPFVVPVSSISGEIFYRDFK